MPARTRAENEWLELVADLLDGPPAALPDERIAVAMWATFGLSGCSFNDVVLGCGPVMNLWPADAGMGGLRAELLEWSRTRAPHEHPLLRFYRHSGRRVPLQIIDVPDRFADRTVGDWSDLNDAVGATHQLALPLSFEPGRLRAFVLGRPEVFGPQDVRLGHLLWRTLTVLDRQCDTLTRLRPVPDLAADLRLTPRQQAVLGLLAEGRTAAAIARRLAIGERTVHKHLAHIYAKLGVTDRLMAVLRARDLGLLDA